MTHMKRNETRQVRCGDSADRRRRAGQYPVDDQCGFPRCARVDGSRLRGLRTRAARSSEFPYRTRKPRRSLAG